MRNNKTRRVFRRWGVCVVLGLPLSLLSVSAEASLKGEEELSEGESTPSNQEQGKQDSLDLFPSSLNRPSHLLIPKGVLDNEQEERLPLPPPRSFGDRIKNPSSHQETFIQGGIDPTELLRQEKEDDPVPLCDLLRKNLFGSTLSFKQAAFQRPKDLLIFDSIGQTVSVRLLDLTECSLNDRAFLALCSGVARNGSLRRLCLDGVPLSDQRLMTLSMAIASHPTLKEVNLRAKFETPLKEDILVRFYRALQSNDRLRLIRWPQNVFPRVHKMFKKAKPIVANRLQFLHHGILLAEGVGLSKDPQGAMPYLKQAYDLAHPRAAYEIAQLLDLHKNYTEALEWYKKSKNQGYGRAFIKLGDWHRKVWPKSQLFYQDLIPDYEKAYESYLVAVEKGSRQGLYKLGRFYEKGRFVPQDLDKAADLYFRACEKGHPDSFSALGALYRNENFKDYNLSASCRYLSWGTRFKKSRAPSLRLLSYGLQDTDKIHEN